MWAYLLVGCVEPWAMPRLPPADPGRVAEALPVWGGSLLATPDSSIFYGADPGASRVFCASADPLDLVWSVDLPVGSEPFRLAEGGGALWASLRGTGEIARIDRDTSQVDRVAVCAEPRGVAWDESRSSLWVACASGELVRLDAGGALQSSILVDADLRDVVVLADRLEVSRFRAAEVLDVDPDSGVILSRRSPPGIVGASPQVAWRMVALPDGDGVAVAHQLHETGVVPPVSGAIFYGAPPDDVCGAVVTSAVTTFRTDGSVVESPRLSAPLPVDLAFDGDGALSVAFAGWTRGSTAVLDPTQTDPADGCIPVYPDLLPTGPLTGVGFAGGNTVLATSLVDLIYVQDETGVHPLDELERAGAGPGASSASLFDLAVANVACASCHPEGRDDGHVWDFGEGPRRTISLTGGLSATAPFDWDGDYPDMQGLLEDVLALRMGGSMLGADAVDDLVDWLDALPSVASTPFDDDAAVARGEGEFYSPEGACATCHAGPRYTIAENQDVGTGGSFQVPSLTGVGSRGPWMHDGCADDLLDRFFDPRCGGTAHGGTYAGDHAADLVAFLQTL